MKTKAGVTHSDEYRIDDYLDSLVAAGVEPVPISPKSPRNLDGLRGLVLCGGTDLNPALYREERHPEADEPEDDLDRMELGLLHTALANDLPVLAICRGMQLFNAAHGGSLDQHIAQWPMHRRYDMPKPEPVHSVEIAHGSRLAGIFAASSVCVNSRHHQAIKALGDGLVVSARAVDGVIEGVERPDKTFAVAVQWHPENQAAHDPVQARLFSAFGDSLRIGYTG